MCVANNYKFLQVSDCMVNYTVILLDRISNETIKEVNVGFDSCDDGTCSTSLSLLPSNLTYSIGVRSTSLLGSSSPTFENVEGKLVSE